MTELHRMMVQFHVLYQLKTGNEDSGQAFVSWFWQNSVDFGRAIDKAIEIIATSHIGDADAVSKDEAKDITWEIANRLEIADKAIRKMHGAIEISD